MCSSHFSPIFLIFTTMFVIAKCDRNFTEVSEADATSIRIRQIPIKVATRFGNSRDSQCRVVNVEEHIHCSQACLIKEADCTMEQSYNKTGCKCECTNTMQKMECDTLEQKVWNKEKCQCICKIKETECMTNFAWNDEFCNCTKISRGA